jgi:hypothetical protein
VNTSVIRATSVAELESALSAQLAAGLGPNLAVVFANEHLVTWQIGRVFAERGIQVFGACSA